MGLTLAASIFALAFGSGTPSTLQQGELQGIYQGNSIQQFERGISTYLNGDMLSSILTPGEFVEWKLDLKAGQVVVGESSSDTFDPAIEMVDDGDKVLAYNDDRYPGDQRPLIFWRCPKDGSYKLHVRSFKNKSGGQVYTRFQTYDTMDIPGADKVEGVFDATKPFLVRVPMKAGQIKDIINEKRGEGNYLNYRLEKVIFPNGLPETSPALSELVYPAIRVLAAPLAGDYYLMYTPYGYRGGNGRVRIGAREVVPTKPIADGNGYTAKAPTNVPAIWEVSVRAGEFVEVSTPDLNATCNLRLAEAPDYSKFAIDEKKPEMNPFFPQLKKQPPDPGPAYDLLPARARDNRIVVFRARRDAKLWLSTDGAGPADKQFAMHVGPGAAEYAEGKVNTGKLKVAKTDYWAFDAKAGDVMTLDSSTPGFSELMLVRDPDLGELRHFEAGLDQTSDSWRMIVQKPGRYLVAVACFGNGGGGEYSLTRKVFHASDFGMSTPAKGEIAEGQVQIWKFTATPNNPLLIHWNSSNWNYDVAIYDEKGQRADFQRQDIDDHNRLGILRVTQPQTFVIVLTGGKDKANYTIELGPIPSFKPAPKDVNDPPPAK